MTEAPWAFDGPVGAQRGHPKVPPKAALRNTEVRTEAQKRTPPYMVMRAPLDAADDWGTPNPSLKCLYVFLFAGMYVCLPVCMLVCMY